MRDYDKFIEAIAPYVGDCYISQDRNGTDRTVFEPNLMRGVGEKRDTHTWVTWNGERAENRLSAVFPNIPKDIATEHSLRRIVGGKAYKVD